jgi:hypothetical protein
MNNAFRPASVSLNAPSLGPVLSIPPDATRDAMNASESAWGSPKKKTGSAGQRQGVHVTGWCERSDWDHPVSADQDST